MPEFELDANRIIQVDLIEVFPDSTVGHIYERVGEYGLTHISYTKFRNEKLVVKCISKESIHPDAIQKRRELWEHGATQMVRKIEEDVMLGRRTWEEVEERRAAGMAKLKVLKTIGEPPPWPY